MLTNCLAQKGWKLNCLIFSAQFSLPSSNFLKISVAENKEVTNCDSQWIVHKGFFTMFCNVIEIGECCLPEKMQLSMMPATVNVPPTIAHTWNKLQFSFQGSTIVNKLLGFVLAFWIMKKQCLALLRVVMHLQWSGNGRWVVGLHGILLWSDSDRTCNEPLVMKHLLNGAISETIL